jgi:hypothetical protein
MKARLALEMTQVRPAPRLQVVETDDLGAFGQKSIAKMRSDETCAASYQHGRIVTFRHSLTILCCRGTLSFFLVAE